MALMIIHVLYYSGADLRNVEYFVLCCYCKRSVWLPVTIRLQWIYSRRTFFVIFRFCPVYILMPIILCHSVTYNVASYHNITTPSNDFPPLLSACSHATSSSTSSTWGEEALAQNLQERKDGLERNVKQESARSFCCTLFRISNGLHLWFRIDCWPAGCADT